MPNLRAKTTGYYGGRIIETGEVFHFSDDEWKDKDKRPSWAEPAGKNADADDDGDDKPKRGRKKADDDGKSKTVEAPEGEPFADEGQTVSEAMKEVGDIKKPDWLPPEDDADDKGGKKK